MTQAKHNELEPAARQAVAVFARQFGTLLKSVVEYRRTLPEVSEPALALQAVASVLEELTLALDHASEELPEIVDSLEKASRATPQSLAKEHAERMRKYREAERA
jgi:DNA repair ATPase RecN